MNLRLLISIVQETRERTEAEGAAQMKRAALYMRVSTVDQHPETQLHDLRQMAAQRGYEIVLEYTDRISGVKARWPRLGDLLRDARKGRFDILLPWSCDRIARPGLRTPPRRRLRGHPPGVERRQPRGLPGHPQTPILASWREFSSEPRCLPTGDQSETHGQ